MAFTKWTCGVVTYVLASASDSTKKLLNDADIWHFITYGYVLVETTHSAAFHNAIFQEARQLSLQEGNPGNNIIPRIPALSTVLLDPNVQGALESILGPDYLLHPHRHMHESFPGKEHQPWHKDSYFQFVQEHHHVPLWVMALYYPQDTTLEIGATGIVAESQYLNEPPLPHEPTHLICRAGTVMIKHYNMLHAASANVHGPQIWDSAFSNSRTLSLAGRLPQSALLQHDSYRYMFKFQFVRMHVPTPGFPTWNSSGSSPVWHPSDYKWPELSPIWEYVWWWLGGAAHTCPDMPSEPHALNLTISKLIRQLKHDKEQQRLNAAYRLAAVTRCEVWLPDTVGSDHHQQAEIYTQGRAELALALLSGREKVRWSAMYGAAAMDIRALPSLVSLSRRDSQEGLDLLCFAIGGILTVTTLENSNGCTYQKSHSTQVDDAFHVLLDTSRSLFADHWARRNAIEALGLGAARMLGLDAPLLPESCRVEQETHRQTLLLEIADALIAMVNGSAIVESHDIAPPRRFVRTVLDNRRISLSLLETQRQFMSTLSLAQIGAAASSHPEAVSTLVQLAKRTLSPWGDADNDTSPDVGYRYLHAYALAALRRVGSNSLQALGAVADLSSEGRWCAHTTQVSLF